MAKVKQNYVQYPTILKQMIKVAGGVKQNARETYDLLEQSFGSMDMEAVEGWLYDIQLHQKTRMKRLRQVLLEKKK